jgi:rSAM/selenodomain-associated transferase 1
MSRTDCAVVVFAKAPLPGYAKTRLVPALGAQGAARLARRLLEAALGAALDARIGPGELCCAPDGLHPAFADLARRTEATLTGQGEGDLGARMARALARSLREHAGAIVIGTDAPALDAAYLRGAAAVLANHDAVFGPARDGGYTLVGLRRPAPALFEGVDWSTAQVMAQTRARLARLGLRHAELAPLADIDEPADLRHLPAAWRPLRPQE